MSLKTIKNKIRSVNKTHKVTKAMEAVSAVKMRKSQEKALIARPYATSALTILSRVTGSVDAQNHLLTQSKKDGKTLLLVVTSDKGLAGSLNSAVIKLCVNHIVKNNIAKEELVIMCLGNKGYDYFDKRGYTVMKHFENLGDEVSSDDMKELTSKMVELFSYGDVKEGHVAYTNFKSTFEQEPILRKVLPITVKEVEEIIRGIVPEKGAMSETPEAEAKRVYTIEPDADEVFAELLPFLLNIELYHSLLEAKASEHSARMVAMKNASDKAEEMSDDLNLEFNKARQSLITREVSEIIGGMEVMNS